jgi:hypothetical protein
MRDLIRSYGTIHLLVCDEIYDESLELIRPAEQYQKLYPVASNGTMHTSPRELTSQIRMTRARKISTYPNGRYPAFRGTLSGKTL